MSDDDSRRRGPATLREAYARMLADGGLDLAFLDKRPDLSSAAQSPGGFDPMIAKAYIRFLESTRGYSTWPSVASEPPVDFLARLANVQKASRPYLGDRLPHAQGVLDRQMTELRGWLADLNIALPYEIFAGVYPTGELNARATPVPGLGALLLVNVGLMDLVFMLLKTNIATPARDEANPLLSEERAERVLAEAFNAYLYGVGSLGAWKLPRLPEERERPLGFVLTRAEQFVLAHEIGHAALGHIAIGDPERRHRVGDYSPEQESDADRFAVDLLVRAHKRAANWEALSPYLAGAVMTFFAVAEALNVLETGLGLSSPDKESHPATDERMNRVATQLQEALPVPGLLDRAGVFVTWLYTATPGIAKWLILVNETMKRPGPYD